MQAWPPACPLLNGLHPGKLNIFLPQLSKGCISPLAPWVPPPALQWVLPAQSFNESGYLASPVSPKWERYEGAAFVAAGFAW